jgi:hypothetical protein
MRVVVRFHGAGQEVALFKLLSDALDNGVAA